MSFKYGSIKNIADFTDDEVTGYAIIAEHGEVKVAIDTFQSCCEDFGKRLHHDLHTTEEFIGAELISVRWGKDKSDREGSSAVVAIETSKGLLEVEVYNEHNGYYPHTAYVEWHDHRESQQI